MSIPPHPIRARLNYVDKEGKPVYRDALGRLYDADGKPYDPPPPLPPEIRDPKAGSQ